MCIEGWTSSNSSASATNENMTKTCLEDGTWSDGYLFCTPVDCGEPEFISNTHIFNTDTIFGSNVSFSLKIAFSTLRTFRQRKMNASKCLIFCQFKREK